MQRWMRFSAAAAVLVAGGTAYLTTPTHADVQPVVVAAPIEIDFRSGTVTVNSTKGTEAVLPTVVNFAGRQVLSAQVVLKGFNLQYDDADHAVHKEIVRFENIDAQGETVKFDTRLLLRDNSGDIDDKYSGTVDYVVFARLK